MIKLGLVNGATTEEVVIVVAMVFVERSGDSTTKEDEMAATGALVISNISPGGPVTEAKPGNELGTGVTEAGD